MIPSKNSLFPYETCVSVCRSLLVSGSRTLKASAFHSDSVTARSLTSSKMIMVLNRGASLRTPIWPGSPRQNSSFTPWEGERVSSILPSRRLKQVRLFILFILHSTKIFKCLSLSGLLWKPNQLHLRGGGWAKKWGTVIPVYSWHTLSESAQHIIPVYSVCIHFQNAHKTQKIANARTLCVYIFI